MIPGLQSENRRHPSAKFKLLNTHHVELDSQRYPKAVWLVTVFEIVVTMGLCAHWMCCLWYLVGAETDEFADSWLYLEVTSEPETLNPGPSLRWDQMSQLTAGYTSS